MADDRGKGLVRGLVDFALNRDIEVEIEALYRMLEAEPSSAAAHMNLGILFYSQGRIEDAMRELLMSIECDSSLGRAYRKAGRDLCRLRGLRSGSSLRKDGCRTGRLEAP